MLTLLYFAIRDKGLGVKKKKEIHEFIETWIKPEKMSGCLMGPDLSQKESWWKEVSFL